MIGFIGAGKMAEAIFSGMLRSGTSPAELGICDVQADRMAALVAKYGIRAFAGNARLVEACDTIILAVKPQELDGVLTEVAPHLSGQCVISIAAGRTIAGLEAALPAARIIRVMPNLACSVGAGMSVLCGGSRVTQCDMQVAYAVFAASGKVCESPEAHFDMVTAVSGSGPAFWTQLVQYEIAKAVASGMASETARLLVLQTMLGTASVLLDGNPDLDQFMQAVASKGGTTAAGLDVLRSSAAGKILGDVLEAAAARSRVLRN
ncbi:MAG: pyrroline-5-carboxylate reductase [Kiritimatiellia bacterium]